MKKTQLGILIAQWRNNGFSNRQIAKWLGRDEATIGREIEKLWKYLEQGHKKRRIKTEKLRQ